MQVIVARIGRPHGIRGDVTIEVRTDDPATRFAVGTQLDTDPADRGPLTITGHRQASKLTLLRFDGVTDRNGAEQLRNTLLLATISPDADDLPDDEYYDRDLVGLSARDTYGTELGIIDQILHGAQTILSIRRADKTTVLVPFVAAIVPEVNLAQKYVIIDPPAGMFT